MGVLLTLFQPEGADYAQHITGSTPRLGNLTTALIWFKLLREESIPSIPFQINHLFLHANDGTIQQNSQNLACAQSSVNLRFSVKYCGDPSAVRASFLFCFRAKLLYSSMTSIYGTALLSILSYIERNTKFLEIILLKHKKQNPFSSTTIGSSTTFSCTISNLNFTTKLFVVYIS